MSPPSNQSARLDYIRNRVETLGRIRRSDIRAVFKVSTPQASCDLGAVQRKWPDLMRYDRSAKHYVLNKATGLPDAPEGSAWLIYFEDQSEKPEIFSGCGAEVAARERFRVLSFAWNCHLFQKIAGHDWDKRDRLARESISEGP